MTMRNDVVVCLPDDVRDAHEAVVHRHAEVVHGQAVGAQQHKVAQRVCTVTKKDDSIITHQGMCLAAIPTWPHSRGVDKS